MTQNEEASPSFNSVTAAFPAYLVIYLSLGLGDEAPSKETYWRKRDGIRKREGAQKEITTCTCGI